MTLAKTIKRLRAARQLTQIQLAKKTKVTQPMIAMLETGAVTNLTLATLRRLAKALCVTPSELLR
jgi:transcriptional regulator with XRE-family HTH domain